LYTDTWRNDVHLKWGISIGMICGGSTLNQGSAYCSKNDITDLQWYYSKAGK